MNVGNNADAAAVAAVMDEASGAPANMSMIPRPGFAVGAPQESLRDDLVAPILQIVHAVGQLAKEYRPGDLVLDKTHLVVPKGKTGRMIVLAWTRYWKTYVSPEQWNAGDRDAQVYATAKDAIAAGHTVDYNQMTGQKATCPVCMQWAMLLEKPDDQTSDLYCLEANGKWYAPARMYLERTAYFGISKPFARAAEFSCKARGIRTAVWEIGTTIYKAKSGNESWVPSIKLVSQLTDAELANLNAALAQ